MTYQEFEARWQSSGGAERANYGPFLNDLCDLLGVPRPNATTDDPSQDAYVLERTVTFDNGPGSKASTGRIDLYKRGCFVLETKQGVGTFTDLAGDIKNRTTHDARRTTHDARRTTHDARPAPSSERVALGLPIEKKRKGHATRGTAKWRQMMEAARQQALNYARALPASEPRPPFVVVADVGYCFDLYSNFAGVGDNYVPFPDSQRFRVPLTALAQEETRAVLRQLFTTPQQLDPSRLAAKVTRQLATQLAALSAQLEQAGHAAEKVATFLMRCLFTMFAEVRFVHPKWANRPRDGW